MEVIIANILAMQIQLTNSVDYTITMPNMYARGILFGKMVLELGEICTIKNDKTGFSCDVDFKTKGLFYGQYNVIAGKVKKGNTEMGELSGKWSSSVEFKPKVLFGL